MIKQVAFGAALSAFALGAHAEFEDSKYDWYVDPMVFYSISDESRGPDVEDGAGARIIFGHRFSQHWAVEAGFVGDQLADNSGPDISRAGLTVDARYDFSDGGFTPFVLAGGGVLVNRTEGQDSDTNAVINLGLGFLWQFHRSGTAIRSEVRAKQISESNEDYTDFDVGVGLHIPLDPENTVAKTVPVPAYVPPESTDDDRDGVHNDVDQCPQTPASTPVDEKGCKIAETLTLRGLQFARNSAAVNLGGPELEQILATMQRYPDIRILVAGHTDSRSTEAYNQQLSEQRANGVKAWLVDRGIMPSRVETYGFGESRPIADNGTAEGRAQNRRVEVQILR